jgi:hypothetical protein
LKLKNTKEWENTRLKYTVKEEGEREGKGTFANRCSTKKYSGDFEKRIAQTRK